jgi:hypothetical protein
MLVNYGFIDIYGIQWDERQVNRYNDLQKRIQAFEESGLRVPSELEMESHKTYQLPYYSTRGGY